jgi:hypothetical protein
MVNLDDPRGAEPEAEHRFLLARDATERFLAAAAGHLSVVVHDAARPIAYTRTTYLDTPDGEYFRTCLTPLARRLRVREYAASPSVDEPARLTGERYLEVKETRGRLRVKRRGALDGPLARPDVQPCVTTYYRRLELAHQRVRITLDEGIAYCLPAPVGQAGDLAEPPYVLEYGPSRVVEVKIRGATPAWLAAAMEALPVRETNGFSKFFAAMLALRRVTSPRAKHRTQPVQVPMTARGRR